MADNERYKAGAVKSAGDAHVDRALPLVMMTAFHVAAEIVVAEMAE